MPDSKPALVLVSRDLFFVSKIQGTAHALGIEVRVASDAAALGRCFGVRSDGDGTNPSKHSHANAPLPRGVLIDLELNSFSAGAILPLLRSYEVEHSCKIATLAFGPHVHTDLLEAAQAAGCDQVMPRSKFSARLPELLQQLATPPLER